MNIEEMIVLSPWHRTRGGSARHIIDAHLSLYRLLGAGEARKRNVQKDKNNRCSFVIVRRKDKNTKRQKDKMARHIIDANLSL